MTKQYGEAKDKGHSKEATRGDIMNEEKEAEKNDLNEVNNEDPEDLMDEEWEQVSRERES